MRVRFASWNVNGFRRLDTQLDLMRQVKPNVLALQEVTPHAYRALADATLFDWIMFSPDLREPQAGEGRKRRLGCVLCGDQYDACAGCGPVAISISCVHLKGQPVLTSLSRWNS